KNLRRMPRIIVRPENPRIEMAGGDPRSLGDRRIRDRPDRDAGTETLRASAASDRQDHDARRTASAFLPSSGHWGHCTDQPNFHPVRFPPRECRKGVALIVEFFFSLPIFDSTSPERFCIRRGGCPWLFGGFRWLSRRQQSEQFCSFSP